MEDAVFIPGPKTRLVESNSLDVHENLAYERYLAEGIGSGDLTLFTWRCERAVIMGYNQRPASQCNLHDIVSDSVVLARRRSGGGTVFHDVGNSTYSFIACQTRYDYPSQLAMLIESLRLLGVQADRKGNDLEVNKRKICGNATGNLGRKGVRLHHGCMPLSTDLRLMDRYVRIDAGSAKRHGATTPSDRVLALRSEYPHIGHRSLVSTLQEVVRKHHQAVYGGCGDAEIVLEKPFDPDDYGKNTVYQGFLAQFRNDPAIRDIPDRVVRPTRITVRLGATPVELDITLGVSADGDVVVATIWSKAQGHLEGVDLVDLVKSIRDAVKDRSPHAPQLEGVAEEYGAQCPDLPTFLDELAAALRGLPSHA